MTLRVRATMRGRGVEQSGKIRMQYIAVCLAGDALVHRSAQPAYATSDSPLPHMTLTKR